MSSEKVPAQPTQIGPYRILEVIGEGGMGTVYLAEQKEPVRRRAALKVIKLGMDSKAVIARFEQERQALALMDHEGIAKVYDCGTTDRGQPYFAMELVKGIPLDQFCEQQKLALEDRIVLMQQVCSAVQHAHQKGVVHRDLKPGNVLVSDHGGKFESKVIDFGLAKAMGQKLVEATLFTEAGQVVGTPEYMAPEQADPTNQDIDTRADVYSLGVMLYQTLCGELPFPGAELRRAGMLEVQRILREVDPPKPSTRVTEMGESGSAVAGNRRVSLGALQRVLRSDLDWVVLKALEKQRNRRYETANALAADLQRFLDHEPLVAGPPSATYRLHKLVQRYRGQVLAGAAVLATALGGAVFAVNYAFEAEEQTNLANARASMIEQLAQKDRVYADLARLQDAASRAAALWPAVPSRIPELERWIAEVEPTLRRLPEVESELALLRQQRAQPVADEVRAAARASVATEIERLQKESDDAQPRERRVLELDLADAEVQLETAGHAFDDRADAERHLQLARLATKIRSFARDLPAYRRGALASVRARLAQAQALAAARPTHEQAWQEAIAAVAASNGTTASTLYEHFVLRDQEGLVPVGMDPVSKLWEFVHLASGTPGKEIPVRDEKTGRLVPTGDMGIVFVLLPGGVLPVEDGMQPDHRHSVRLDPFFLSKYEMTQGQWLRLAGRIPAAPAKGNNLALPVYQVSWFDSEELLRLQGLMLPSELQWEYGIRGGTRTRWWTGTTEESLAEKENMNTPFGSLFLPVGSLAANGFGLLDMGGNACEWCLDEDGDYGTERAGDGLRAPAGAQNRLYRGGDVAFGAESAQSSFRLLLQPPSFRTHFIGLRPARTARP